MFTTGAKIHRNTLLVFRRCLSILLHDCTVFGSFLPVVVVDVDEFFSSTDFFDFV